MEIVEAMTTVVTVQRNALGARGTDMIERTTSGGVQTRFPLSDAHGNSVATLGRLGTSWTLGDERAYDAWGKIRFGGQMGAPSSRYCASLGHVQDDESGLVSMRARYYEPGTGRFVSQDPAMDGANWFSSCANDPVNLSDGTGKVPIPDWNKIISGILDYLHKNNIEIPNRAEAVAHIPGCVMNILAYLKISQSFDAAAARSYSMAGAIATGPIPGASIWMMSLGMGATAISSLCKTLCMVEAYKLAGYLALLWTDSPCPD